MEKRKRHIFFTLLSAMLLLITTGAFADPNDSLLKALSVAKDDTNKAALLCRMAINLRYQNPDEGLKYALRSVDLAKKLEWQIGIGRAYSAIGNSYLTRGEYASSMEAYLKARDKFEEIGARVELSKSLVNIGILKFMQGNYPGALQNYFTALKINEELNNKADVASCLVNIGIVYSRQHNFAKALEYFFKSEKLATDINDKPGLAMCYGNIGLVYKYQAKYDEALQYYQKSLDINQSLNRKTYIQTDFGNIGNVYRNLGEYNKALSFLFASAKIGEELGDKGNVSISYGNIGDCYLNIITDSLHPIHPDTLVPASRSAILQKAIEYNKKALALSSEIGDLDGIQEVSKSLSEALSLTGNHKEALVYLTQHIKYKDSIFSQQNKMQMANLEAKRDIELKERDLKIEKLKAANKRNERVLFIVGLILIVVIMLAVLNRFMKAARSKEKKHLDRIKEQSNVLESIAYRQAHDIRAQVAKILGLSRLYNHDEPSDPTNVSIINNITEVTENLDGIVRDIISTENKFNRESREK